MKDLVEIAAAKRQEEMMKSRDVYLREKLSRCAVCREGIPYRKREPLCQACRAAGNIEIEIGISTEEALR